MPLGRDLGVLGVKNFSVGICDGAQTTAHSSLSFVKVFIFLLILNTRTLVKSEYQKNNSYFSTKIYVVGCQKNRLNETVLLSTQNIC